MHYKLKAFTLIDLLVTMVISSIIIVCAMTAYSIYNRQTGIFFNNANTIMSHAQLNWLLKNDFDRSYLIKYQTGNFMMYDKNGSVLVNYSFTDSAIIRESLQVVDSFPLKQHKETITYISDPEYIVNGLTLETYFQGNKQLFYYHKDYSSETLIKLNDRADY